MTTTQEGEAFTRLHCRGPLDDDDDGDDDREDDDVGAVVKVF